MKRRKFYFSPSDFYAPALAALLLVLLAAVLMTPSMLDAGRIADTVVAESVAAGK